MIKFNKKKQLKKIKKGSRGGSGGGGESWGSGPFLHTPKLHKEGKKRRACAQEYTAF